MRATGFGHKSPKDETAALLYPSVLPDGTSLDMAQKTITEQRRELIITHKLNASNEKGVKKSLETITLEPEPSAR